MNKDIKTYKLIIRGKVQNVGFRYWFYQEAVTLDLKGYVKNKHNNNEVVSIIQGQFENVMQIVEKCKEGPRLAIVEKVISMPKINNEIYTSFIIK